MTGLQQIVCRVRVSFLKFRIIDHTSMLNNSATVAWECWRAVRTSTTFIRWTGNHLHCSWDCRMFAKKNACLQSLRLHTLLFDDWSSTSYIGKHTLYIDSFLLFSHRISSRAWHSVFSFVSDSMPVSDLLFIYTYHRRTLLIKLQTINTSQTCRFATTVFWTDLGVLIHTV